MNTGIAAGRDGADACVGAIQAEIESLLVRLEQMTVVVEVYAAQGLEYMGYLEAIDRLEARILDLQARWQALRRSLLS